ncbi:MAG: Gfo/Idh/MocA family oxidoreductase [Brevefilum sp.]|nr:Gfo/Idh/MocA family oxidoreductase [Brevefilum sp.]MDT8382411.1 Gfo/Idh/MocA family oxidoreductase [Brevefilum sp.]MDW7753933.1 Gfo/Idh/MocA family oxidoreductase [Brevefilum sp.]
MTLKTAVIGVGSMGKNHARIYWELPNADLVGVADFDKDTADSIANKYGTKAYYDYKVLLDEAKPDAVTLAVPTIYHRDIALEIIDRGIPLLIEKPIAFTIEEGQSIIDAARKKNVKLMIGHIERFNPAIITLKDHVSQGKLGRIFQMDAHRQGPFPARIADVGVVVDLAVHDLDVMRFVSQKEIIRVYAETEKHIHSKYEDLLTGLVRFSDGIIGTLTINWLTPTKIREFIVTGERGLYRCDYLTQDLFFFENPVSSGSEWDNLRVLRGVREGQMVRHIIAKKEPLRSEQEAFLDAVENDKPVAVSGEDGLRALELAKTIVKSGTDHRIISTEVN